MYKTKAQRTSQNLLKIMFMCIEAWPPDRQTKRMIRLYVCTKIFSRKIFSSNIFFRKVSK